MAVAARWFVLIIATWSVIAVWAGDPLPKDNTAIYLSLLAVVAFAAWALEVRDWVKSKREKATVPQSDRLSGL
jgi:hypothetical protein